ncbi:MAG: mitochondrial fission ELM1 family protein [Planctomycetaceae bacterium]|nr:mitochondrial fission ELM1 family protein [Planctomycetaceae bacterium]
MAPGFSSSSGSEPRGAQAHGHAPAPHFRASASLPDDRFQDAPVCWGLSIGVAGMLSQMRGVAQSAGFRFEPKKTRLKRGWHWLPLSLVPTRMSVVRDADTLDSRLPPPLIITCGRHSVIPAICLKERWGARTFVVFVQNPLVDPANFDLVIAPEHDGVTGDNVINTRGALHHVTPELLATARDSDAGRELQRPGQPVVTVLLGGPNRCYGFSKPDIARLIDKLRMVVQRDNARLIIVSSRRTPEPVRARFVEEFSDHYVWDPARENPYLAALAVADAIVVTCDSVSMTSEAAATGRPVFIEPLTERFPAPRFRRFQDSFRHAGITRRFEGRLEHWTYTPPDDAARIGRIIREEMGLPPNHSSSISQACPATVAR